MTHFGFKDHVAADEEFELIRGYGVTGAATHDSVPYLDTMPEEPAYPGQEAYADSAYTGDKYRHEVEGTGLQAADLREGLSQSSADGRAEDEQPFEVEGALPG